MSAHHTDRLLEWERGSHSVAITPIDAELHDAPPPASSKAMTSYESCNAHPIDTVLVNQRLLRLPAVQHLTGLSRSTVYRLVAAGQFPAHVKLSARATAWRAHEVLAWIAARSRP
jgi:prophage regulatory protein